MATGLNVFMINNQHKNATRRPRFFNGKYRKYLSLLGGRSPPSVLVFHPENQNRGLKMIRINLRDYYPFYTSDFFIEVADEIVLSLKHFDLDESAYQLRTYRHKTYYSLDRNDGIEHEAVFVSLSPQEIDHYKVHIKICKKYVGHVKICSYVKGKKYCCFV